LNTDNDPKDPKELLEFNYDKIIGRTRTTILISSLFLVIHHYLNIFSF